MKYGRINTHSCQRFLLAILFILLTGTLPGMPGYHFRHLDLEDGLSQITVNCIFQDSYGLLWFGTEDGLNLYDGYEFIHFNSDPVNKNSLSHNWIWDVFEDSNHQLWVSTWNGLTRISPDKKNFARYYPDADTPGNIRGERPVSVIEDKNGMIWIGTWGGGLNRYNPGEQTFSSFSKSVHTEKEMPGDFIRKILRGQENNLWIGTWSGLWKAGIMDTSDIDFQYIELIPAMPGNEFRITSLVEDKDGNIWVGTLGQGVFRVSADGKVLNNFRADSPPGYGLSSNQVSSIARDKSGNTWIGTVSNGVDIINPMNRKIIHLENVPDDPFSLSGNNIHSMFVDNAGLVWLGTVGLNIFNSSCNKFNLQLDMNAVGRPVEDVKNVSSIMQDASARLWVGTEDSGLFCIIDGEKNDEDSWIEQVLQELEFLNIGAIVSDDNRTIWIGTRGNGLIKLIPKKKQIINIIEHEKNPGSRGMNFINGLAFIPPSSLWIATYDRGLILYDISMKTYRKFLHNEEDPSSFPANFLLRIYKDNRDKLWICSWGAGIIHFDPQNLSWKTYTNTPDDPFSLSDNIPLSVCESSGKDRNRIWIGTRKGLSLIMQGEGNEPGFTNFYKSDGLPGNVIKSIVKDDGGLLWISTNSGLCLFNPDSLTFRKYDKNDGLQGNQFNAGAGAKLTDNRLAFGGANGLNVFYPDSISTSNYNPPVVITSFRVFNDQRPFNPGMKKIRLDYNENFLSFEFASLDYSQPMKNRYKYRMEGIDREWVPAGERRFASYTDMSPGRYTFQVMGTNSEGIWSTSRAESTIIVSPPYWQTWWFRAVIILFIALLIYLFMAYRIRKIRELERLRVNIATDLHDDIGSALTRINIHSQQLKNNTDKEKISSSVEKIGELSREITSTMSDIVWSIDARNDNLNDMLDRMRDFAYTALSEKDISVEFIQEGLDKNTGTHVKIRQNLFSIFKEVVNNIVKHSGADMVKIELMNTDRGFSMNISDNGKGFDPGEVNKGNGLKNMRMRADRIDARIDMEINDGTRIYLWRKTI